MVNFGKWMKNFAVIGLLVVAIIATTPNAAAEYISLEKAVVGENHYWLKSAEGEIIYADFNPRTTPAWDVFPSGWAMNRIAKINHRSLDQFWQSAGLDVYYSTDGTNWKWKQHGSISYPVTTIIKMQAGLYYRFIMRGFTAPYYNIHMDIVQDVPWNY